MGANVRPDCIAEALDGGDRTTVEIDVKHACVGRFNAKRSFACMTARRLQRRYQGVYKKKSFLVRLITCMFVVYTLSMLATVAFVSSTTSRSSSVLYATAIICGIFTFTDVTMVVQWLLFWLLLAQLLNYVITGKLYALFYQSETLTDLQSAQRNAILITLVTVELLTVGVAVSLHTIYPALVRWSVLNVMRWWDVRPGRRNNTLTYRPSPILHTKKRHSIVYSGGLNAKGQPHGYGMWTDTACNGEQLTGQWKDGIPIGPFRSFEHGSGYCFVNLRIGYCHNRAESRSDTTFHVPKHSPDGLHWGVASVECSVSGGFFRLLPGVSHLTPFNGGAEEPQNAAEVLPFLRTPADDMGFRSRVERTCSSLESVSLRCAARDKEALVFLHGFNCPLDYSLSRLAQLLALGDFPSHIHPFVFSWPSGGPLSYFQAKATGTDSEKTSNDLKLFLESLGDAGYKNVHIVAHSMGARIYFSALQRGVFDAIFASVRTDSEHPQARMQLCTLIFCNPDYSRDEFVKYGGAYDQSSRFCRHITLYADNLDGALFYAEIFSKRTVFGPLEYSLGRRGYTIHRDTQDQSEDQDLVAMQECNISHPVALDAAVVLVNQQRQFDGVKFFAYNDESEEVVESSSCTGQDRAAVYLDMDVIDATWMDNNVHSIRHNYFNLNPTLVEDLRQLIVGKKRASERPSLLKTMAADNVYIFLVAPSHVKNK